MLILVLLLVSFITVMFHLGCLISLTHLCFIAFLSLYIALIDVLIYSAAQLQKCLINLLTYLLIQRIASYQPPQYRILIYRGAHFLFLMEDYAFSFKLLSDLTGMIANDMQDFPLNSNFNHWNSLTWIKTVKVIKRRHQGSMVSIYYSKNTLLTYLPVMVSISMLQ